MKVLVLGGHGFVGRNVVAELQSTPHQVSVLSRRDGLDLTDLDATTACFAEAKPDVVVNLAARVGSLNMVTRQAADIVDSNMRILLNIYQAMIEGKGDQYLINPIANCAFPGHLESYSEDRLWDGNLHKSVLSYGSTRRMALVLSECYLTQYGVRSINLLVPNMYGPYDSTDPNKAHALNALISKVVKAQAEGCQTLEVWGSGVAIREWLYARDFGKAVVQTIERLAEYGFAEPVNIAQNFGLSVRELVDIIVKQLDFGGAIVWNREMPDGAPRKVMDDTRFRKVFPKFDFTDLKSGIVETIHYYKSVYPY